jgi:hypothetical protein
MATKKQRGGNEMKDGDSAFPVRERWDSGADQWDLLSSGLTMKQYAAIHLKVPRSGDADIDAMIRESRRAELAGQALAGYSVMFPETGAINPKSAAEWCCGMADAMIAELEKEAGK